MHSMKKRVFVIACVCGLAIPFAASAFADVKVDLVARRVTQNASGKEVLAAADEARPGEVIEYQATYSNDGTTAVNKLVATLPIPEGLEYLPKTVRPAPALASLDGKTFAAMPLKRKVRLADGREVEREVATSEYRFLRWTLGSLPGGRSQVVRARARVAPLTVAARVDR